MKKSFLLISLLLVLGALFNPLFAEKPGDNLEVGVLVVGQGDPFFTAWGHIGLVIRNTRDKTYYMYDYGNFSFSEEDFFVNFAFGRLIYLAMKMRARPYEDYIIRTDRDLTLYHLNLPPEKKMEMMRFLEWNTRKKNSKYLYHHYNDNCSTRIRDVIDIAMDGQLKDQTDYLGQETFRSLSRKYSEGYYIVGDWMTTFLQAGSVDRPITLWEEMYIPDILGETIADTVYTNPDGEEVSLVSKVEVLHETDRFGIVPDTFKPVWYRGLLVGLAAALLGGLPAYLALKKKKGKALWPVFQLVFGIIIGLMGVLLLFMMLFTDHEVTYGNFNWLITSPLALLVIPAFIMGLSKKEKTARRGQFLLPYIWVGLSLMSLAGFLLARIPALYQQNGIIFLTFFPVQLLGALPVFLKKRQP